MEQVDKRAEWLPITNIAHRLEKAVQESAYTTNEMADAFRKWAEVNF
jgi:hypothetical protein